MFDVLLEKIAYLTFCRSKLDKIQYFSQKYTNTRIEGIRPRDRRKNIV